MQLKMQFFIVYHSILLIDGAIFWTFRGLDIIISFDNSTREF